MKLKTLAWIGGTIIVLAAGGFWLWKKRGPEPVKWRQAKVEKGNITQRISATGTLSALIQVNVGTQVSGTVMELLADYNSLVKKGQVIARIDSTVWETQLKDAEASLTRAQANYDNARADYQRNKRLAEEKLVSEAELEAKFALMKTAQGNLESAKASVEKAKINLGYCTITAPVDGVVVSRAVDVGQTVAASFNTPNLFIIAQDLSKLKVEASIDEADIGQVRSGQKAFFTVDSYPERQFSGTVSEVRLEPVINQNVVTYKVVMEVANEPKDGPAAEDKEDSMRGKGEGKRGDPASKLALDASKSATKGRMRGLGGGPQDLDAVWERIKDRLPEGMSKEVWKKRAVERMSKAEVRPSAGGASGTSRYIQPGSPVYMGSLALVPGMTANVTIVTNRKQDVLRVPSVALRFNPLTFIKDDKSKKENENSRNAASPQGERSVSRSGSGPMARGMVTRREDKIWVLENAKPKALPGKAGISDGQFTEISGEGIQEGLNILVGVEDAKKPASNNASPIGAPGMPGGRR